ncbi:MAG: helicase-related protein [Candidatus Gastranaerophilales bacterium]
MQKIHSLYAKNLGDECVLTKTARLGILSHYSNIPQGIRSSVEYAMKTAKAKFIICTSTLAQGVNLPLRYLIVSSTQQGVDRISTRDFQNLIGRAGRAGMYTEGSIIFANNSLFDKRMHSKGRYKWNNVKELLEFNNTEQCNSILFKIFEPIHNNHQWDKYRYIIKMDALKFAIHYVNDTINEFITEIMEHETKIVDGQDIGFKIDSVKKQCEEKINIIKSIEGFILSHIDLNDFSEENLVALVQSTLAYHLGNKEQKTQFIELFNLIAQNIKNKVPEAKRRIYFSKTLYGVNATIELEKWIKDNVEQLILATEIRSFVNLIMPIFSKIVQSKYFDRCSSKDYLEKIMVDWINGKAYYELLDNLNNNKICLKTTKQTHNFTIDDVINFCENTLAFDGSLFVGTLIEIIQGIYGDDISSEVMEDLKLKQKMIKYGLNNAISINIYELGFVDRIIAQDLTTIMNKVSLKYGNKKELRAMFKHNKTSTQEYLSKYPSYFVEKLDFL